MLMCSSPILSKFFVNDASDENAPNFKTKIFYDEFFPIYGTSQNKASGEIKPEALSIVELCLDGGFNHSISCS